MATDETPEAQPAARQPSRPSAARTRVTGRVRGALDRRRQRSDEEFERRFSRQFAQHWAQTWSDRRQEPAEESRPSIHPGPSNFARAQVPYGVDLAAAWSWRFIVIAVAGYLVARAVAQFSLLVMPLVIALFLAALVIPLVDLLSRWLTRGIASLLTVVGVLGLLALMLTFATQQVVDGAEDLATQVVNGLDEIQLWLQEGPLHASEQQIDDAIEALQNLVTTSSDQLVSQATSVGTAIGNIVAAFFLVLFASFFFLADGARIWAWVVRLFPRAARERADSSGRAAWTSLTQFVRATILVAFVDAVGIMVAAAVLDVPFVLAIGLLVFLGGFVPFVGATVSGLVATLVALVDQGPIVALIMLACVLAVQQLESNILQPFLMGRMVSLHPLGVLVSIGAGIYVAGIAGALVAVPLVASVNAVVVHLSRLPGDGVAEGPEQGTVEVTPASDLPPDR